ncbi:hypothetical protein DMB90_00940 [Raoultella planticola]|uniref:Uncharacterized protein n=1 Tax=Raoultella planticola TaxID=575 RepID=A0A5P6A9C8_RAOPL|nr:hypothetical protein DMB90_00940 [Raoultella planticola]
MFLLFVAAMAHILLSGTYKSNNFSRPFSVCTLTAQLACKTAKECFINRNSGFRPAAGKR